MPTANRVLWVSRRAREPILPFSSLDSPSSIHRGNPPWSKAALGPTPPRHGLSCRPAVGSIHALPIERYPNPVDQAQGLTNGVLRTGVPGVGLGSHTATAVCRARISVSPFGFRTWPAIGVQRRFPIRSSVVKHASRTFGVTRGRVWYTLDPAFCGHSRYDPSHRNTLGL